MQKKVLAIAGSPRIGGNSDLLADAFLEGAAEKGHEVMKINLGKLNINFCRACAKCYDDGIYCVQNDDMKQVYDAFDDADVVAFATPFYKRQFSAQMKAVIDRLHTLGHPELLKAPLKECVLLLVAGAEEDMSFYMPLIEYYRSIVEYPKWKDLGYVLAKGVREIGDIKKSEALDSARDLGRSIQF